MPNLGENPEDIERVNLIKLLLLSDSKGGKTHWAARAALAGFNVLYLDGDVAIQTIMGKELGLPPEALKRISYLNIADYLDDNGGYVPFMAKFFVEFTTTPRFLWNDTKGRILDKKSYERILDADEKVVGGDRVWQIRPSRLDSNTVLILDSWTTLVTSLQQWKASDLGIDILEIEKLERDMYTGTAHKATQFLQLLRALPCHLIVIGHPREYQKKSVPDGSKGTVPERDMRVEWTRMVPASTSNPHALTMGKNFSDIGWIDMTKGGQRFIDFKPTSDRVVGGHSKERHKIDEFDFIDLVKLVGGNVTPDTPTDAWLTKFGPGEYEAAPAKVLGGSTPATAQQVKGLSGLAALKAKGVQK